MPKKKFSPPLPVPPRPLVVGEDSSLPQVESKGGGGGGEEDGGEEEASRRRRKAKGETARPRRRHRNPAQVLQRPFFSRPNTGESSVVFILPWEVGKEEELGMISRLVIKREKQLRADAGGDLLYVQRKRGIALPLLFSFFAEQRRTYAGIELIRTYIYIHLFCGSCKGIENSLAHILTTFIVTDRPATFSARNGTGRGTRRTVS